MSKEKIDEKDLKTSEKDENQEIHTPETNNDTLEQEIENSEDSVEEDEIESDESTIQKLQDDLAEAKDKYLRLYSEYENFRRRTAKEKLELMQTATDGLMSSLIPVRDDFDRAEGAFAEKSDLKSIKKGLELISNKFHKILEQQGLKEMVTKKGTDFDPDLHEAITQIPSPKPKLKGKIVDTVEKGYYLGEKVIRHAKVVIGN